MTKKETENDNLTKGPPRGEKGERITVGHLLRRVVAEAVCFVAAGVVYNVLLLFVSYILLLLFLSRLNQPDLT